MPKLDPLPWHYESALASCQHFHCLMVSSCNPRGKPHDECLANALFTPLSIKSPPIRYSPVGRGQPINNLLSVAMNRNSLIYPSNGKNTAARRARATRQGATTAVCTTTVLAAFCRPADSQCANLNSTG